MSVESNRSITGNLRELQRGMRTWLPGLIVVTIASAVALDLAGDVWLQEGFAWDVPTMLAIHRFSTPWLDQVMMGLTHLGTYGAGLTVVVASIWLWRQQDRLGLSALWISFLSAVLLNQVLKLFFARPRPDVFPPLTVEHSYSFPSGHMMAAVSVYGFIALILWKRRQRLLALMSALLIPVVGFTRIYLGVHYPSDVVGALAVGVAWLFLVYAGYRRESNE